MASMDSGGHPGLNITIKWAGKEFPFEDLDGGAITVLDLKKMIWEKTHVQPQRQKLLNLKQKGKPAPEEALLSNLDLKAGVSNKIMMMGSSEQAIADVKEVKEDPNVINDFEEATAQALAIELREEYLSKVEKRVQSYEVKVLNEPRPGKKLLVLDIDYTLFDHRSVAECGAELMRPYLHEFLTSAYQDYDIVIWSATNMKWIEEKMKVLGCDSNPEYKLTFYLDSRAMISIHSQKYGVIEVKPLGVIWGKFPDNYTKSNTIMFDDLRRNFLMNPTNGLKIRPFKNAHTSRATDRELVKLTQYLKKISSLDTFENLDHKYWEKFLSKG